MHLPGVLGQAPDYSEEQFFAILERYSDGEHLLKILEEDGMPRWSTFWKRCVGPNATEELRTAYTQACAAWAERQLTEVPAIADNADVGTEETVSDGPKGQTTTRRTGDRVDHRRLRVQARQWFAERMVERLAKARANSHFPGAQGGVGGALAPVVPAVYITVVHAPQHVAEAPTKLIGGSNGSGNGSGT